MDLNQEQLVHELERKCLAATELLAATKTRVAELETELAAKADEITQHKARADELKAAEQQVSSELGEATREKAQLQVQLNSIKGLSDQRLQEIHAERERVADQAKQLVALQKSETKALQEHARLEAQLAPLQLDLTRLRKELATEKAHLEEAQAQLVEKSRAFTEFRLQSHKKISEVEHQCISAKDDAADLRLQVARLQDEKNALREELKVERESNLEIQTEHERVVGHLEKELAAQHRLTDLYKDSSQTAASKVHQLQALCDSLQTSLKEAEDALAEESSKVREESQQATLHLFEAQTQLSEAKIDELQAAVAKAQARVAELEAANAAAASRVATIAEFSTTAGELHLAENGLSATDMYDRIVQLDATVQAERAAKEKLEVYLERVLHEIQSKAPYLERLKKENARALASHDALSDRLEATTHELGKARDQLRAAHQEKAAVAATRDSLQQSVADLSRQLQTLLYTSVQGTAPAADESLVVYRSVEELQVRNQQLLQIVRDLSEKRAGPAVVEPVEADDGAAPWSQAQWEQVHTELAALREERVREQEMVAAIVKQRDMYRVLLSQADSRYTEAPEAKSPRRPSLDLGSHDARLLRELRVEFEDYKTEKQRLVASLRDTVDGLRAEVAAAKVRAMEAQVEAKANHDKCALAESRKGEAEAELLRFRAKYEQSNALLLQHQASLAELSAAVDAKTDALVQLESAHRAAEADRAYLRRQEERLTAEVTQLRLDGTNQLKLMDAVRRIESYQTDRAAAELERLQAAATALEAKAADRQKALDDAQALAAAREAELALELKAARKGGEVAAAELAAVREARAALEEQVRGLSAAVAAKTDEVLSLRATLAKGAGVAAAERVAALETAAEDAKRELHAALAAKQTAETHAEQYKVISEAHEKSLAALSASSATWKAAQAAALEAAVAERDATKEEMAKLQKKMLENMVEENKLRQEMDAWDAAKRVAVQQAEERALLAEKARDAAQREAAALAEQLTALDADLARARDDYSRELQKHSAAVVAGNDLRREMDEVRRAAKAEAAAATGLRDTLATIEDRHAEAVGRLQAAVDEAVAAKAALAEQNALLHSQLAVLAQDIGREHDAAVRAAGETSGDAEKQLRDLRGVVTYLRRELDIAASKLELATQEALRYQTTARALEKTVDKLKAEQEAGLKLQASALLTTEDQAKRAAALDTLSLLRESNAMLRAENEVNAKKVKEKDAALAALEAKLGPLAATESLLKGQIQNLTEDVESLHAANKRWKNRVDQLIEKYQQIDPEEHERVCAERNALKAQVEALEKSARDAAAELTKVQPQTLELQNRKDFLEERVQKLQMFVKNWKERCLKSEARVAELEAAAADVDAKSKEWEAKVKELEAKGKELEAKAKDGDAAKVLEEKVKLAEAESKKALDAEAEKNDKLKSLNTKLMTMVKASAAEIAQLQEKLRSAETAAVEEIDAAPEAPPAPEPPVPELPVASPVVKAVVAAPPLPAEPKAAPVAEAKAAIPVVEPKAVAPTAEAKPAPTDAEAVAPAPVEEADGSASLREMALKSLLKKSKLAVQKKEAAPPASPAKPTVVIPTPAPASTSTPLNPMAPAFTAAPTVLGSAAPFAAPPAPMAPLKLAGDAATTSPSKTNPFLNLQPPMAFGASGAAGLVFGGNSKITLPVPTMPAETPEVAETEEQRLQQRLQRFKRAATSAVESAPPAKKPTPSDEAAAADDVEETKEAAPDAAALRIEIRIAVAQMASWTVTALRDALAELGVSASTPGARGDERRAILLARYHEATGAPPPKPMSTTVSRGRTLSMTDLRRELEKAGVSTATPGLRGEERREALLERWQRRSDNQEAEVIDAPAAEGAAHSPMKQSQEKRARAEALRCDLATLRQARNDAVAAHVAQTPVPAPSLVAAAEQQEALHPVHGVAAEQAAVAALQSLEAQIRAHHKQGFQEMARANPLLAAEPSLNQLRRQSLPVLSRGGSARVRPVAVVDRARIQTFSVPPTTTVSPAEKLGRKAFFLHRFKEDFDAAEQAYSDAIELEPRHGVNLGHFALFLDHVRGRMDDAEELYLRAVDGPATDATALSNYASFLNRVRRDSARAEEYYRRGVREFPLDASHLGNYANFLRLTKHDADGARLYYEKALAIHGDHVNNLAQYASFLTECNELPAAQRAYERALALAPDDANVCGNFANMLRKADALGRAKELYLTALRLDPDNAVVAQNYALLLRDYPAMRTGETRRIHGHPRDRLKQVAGDVSLLTKGARAFQLPTH
ncbi:nuclear mitotic apparatus protein [Achlya hypogyna]|uniref:Nuclear mitotic apparatus protein n=1 Tax=Achlya hypogyna TaxID=1202772 RepID=A0A1V9ZGE4_ACHHY|nr:nuclear mitotic apparatus protein [Achlya hypogyna]